MEETELKIQESATGFILRLKYTDATGVIKNIKLMKAKLSKDGSKMNEIRFFMHPEILKMIIVMYIEKIE